MFRNLIYALVAVFFCSGIAAAQNVVQITGQGTGECPTGGQSKLVTGVATLETTGRPVLLTATFEIHANPTGGHTVTPLIDGVGVEGGGSRFVGEASGQIDMVSLTHLYSLDKGSHTFAVQATCQSQVIVASSTLIVYELPKH